MKPRESVIDATNFRNVIWVCKRARDLLPYPQQTSLRIENFYQANTKNSGSKIVKFEINADNIITFHNGAYQERNLSTNACLPVYRVVFWAFCDRNADNTFKGWQLFSIKECVQIEDSFKSKSLIQHTIRDKGIINFNLYIKHHHISYSTHLVKVTVNVVL